MPGKDFRESGRFLFINKQRFRRFVRSELLGCVCNFCGSFVFSRLCPDFGFADRNFRPMVSSPIAGFTLGVLILALLYALVTAGTFGWLWAR